MRQKRYIVATNASVPDNQQKKCKSSTDIIKAVDYVIVRALYDVVIPNDDYVNYRFLAFLQSNEFHKMDCKEVKGKSVVSYVIMTRYENLNYAINIEEQKKIVNVFYEASTTSSLFTSESMRKLRN